MKTCIQTALKYIFLSLIFILIGCEAFDPGEPDFGEWKKEPYPEVELKVQRFQDCHELKQLKNKIDKKVREYNQLYSPPDVAYPYYAEASEPGASDSLASSLNMTNSQLASVAEADFVKGTQDQFFVSRKGGVQVLNHSLKDYGEILSSETNSKPLLLLVNNQLILIEELKAENNDYYYPSTSLIYHYPINRIKVRTFDLYNEKLPVKVNEVSFQGQLKTLRQRGDQIYFVINHNHYSIDRLLENDRIYTAKNILEEIGCHRVYKKSFQDASLSITEVIKLDIKSLKTEKVGVMGETQNIYMTEKNLYLTNQIPKGFTYNGFQKNLEKIIIKKISLNDKEMRLTHVGEARGYVKDSWAFKEYDEKLVVVTTTTQTEEGSLVDSVDFRSSFINNLYVFESCHNNKLEKSGEVVRFAPREDIRAVRYINDKAYVVTYEKTDPLFIFDLSDLREPQILGQLKVPGFSTYLHPLGDHHLLGVGFSTTDRGSRSFFQGIQISLFDLSSESEPLRVDVKEYGERGSSSIVNSDHHGFYFDPASNVFSVPTLEINEWGEIIFSGARLFKKNQNELSEISSVSHSDMTPQNCFSKSQWQWWGDNSRTIDVDRVFIKNKKVFSFSKWGVKIHNLENHCELKKLQFKRTSENCENQTGLQL